MGNRGREFISLINDNAVVLLNIATLKKNCKPANKRAHTHTHTHANTHLSVNDGSVIKMDKCKKGRR